MNEIQDPSRATIQEVAAEIIKLRNRVEDLEDLRDLNTAVDRNHDRPLVAWEELCGEFGWNFSKNPDSVDSVSRKKAQR